VAPGGERRGEDHPLGCQSAGDATTCRRSYGKRLERGAIRFSLEVQIAQPGDAVNDPSAAWPKDRERVVVGTLSIDEVESGREQGGDVLVFDPTRVTDGIELSDDPVLQFRSSAYSASVARRVSSD